MEFDVWAQSLLIAVGSYIGVTLLLRILRRIDRLSGLVNSTSRIWIASLALQLGSLQLPFHSYFLKAFLFVSIFQGGLWTSHLIINFLDTHLNKDPNQRSARSLMIFAARVLIWAVVILLILENAKVDVTALIAGLGIGGIAIALAVQNVLGDLLASLSIILDKPFVVGETVRIGALTGVVEKIGIKTTRIRELSGEEVIMSNTEILKSVIQNLKRMNERRITFRIGVRYETPLEKVKLISSWLKTIVDDDPDTRTERVHFVAFGDSALLYEVTYYVLSQDFNEYMDAQERINIAIAEKFKQEGVSFAYPTRTVIMESAVNKP